MRFISTTYLALTHSPCVGALAEPSDAVDVTTECPALEEYMRLWHAIGGPLDWDGRLRASAEELATILSSSDTEIHLARIRGEAIGLCEFSMSASLGSEIVYFGLIPAFQGRRLEPYLLDIALRRHWTTHHPRHVWLHTDNGMIPGRCRYTNGSASKPLRKSICRKRRPRRTIARSLARDWRS
ncbi:N-acetyltransferase [Methylosinus sp. Ce-a6]|uniref:N-acetyltransferase n=1 Tax=Methylosinus sp. Ce-a6 TaxID=2172005 RepID=UPI001FCE9944|nr:N-acetyltransferase [Methylosinus sp. Ce-a6]